jgi:hypothetical protein
MIFSKYMIEHANAALRHDNKSSAILKQGGTR